MFSQIILLGVEDEKIETKVQPANDKVLGVPVTPAKAAGQMVGTVVSPGMATTLELRNPVVHVKGNSSSVSPPNAVISSEAWLQIQVSNFFFLVIFVNYLSFPSKCRPSAIRVYRHRSTWTKCFTS